MKATTLRVAQRTAVKLVTMAVVRTWATVADLMGPVVEVLLQNAPTSVAVSVLVVL